MTGRNIIIVWLLAFGTISANAEYKHCSPRDKGLTGFIERQGEVPVWVNRGRNCIYYYRAHRNYCTTKNGAVEKEKDAIAKECRATLR